MTLFRTIIVFIDATAFEANDQIPCASFGFNSEAMPWDETLKDDSCAQAGCSIDGAPYPCNFTGIGHNHPPQHRVVIKAWKLGPNRHRLYVTLLRHSLVTIRLEGEEDDLVGCLKLGKRTGCIQEPNQGCSCSQPEERAEDDCNALQQFLQQAGRLGFSETNKRKNAPTCGRRVERFASKLAPTGGGNQLLASSAAGSAFAEASADGAALDFLPAFFLPRDLE